MKIALCLVLSLAALLLLVVAASPLLDLLPFSLPSRFAHDRDLALATPLRPEVVREADLQALPPPVQTYLRRVGVVGKARVHNFRVKFSGTIRPTPDSAWMPFEAEQYSFVAPATRLFLLTARRAGIRFQAFHRFVGDTATMRVRVAGLVDIVDARGPEMNQGETVTFFNDVWLLAPAALLDLDVAWLSAGPHEVTCALTRGRVRVTAQVRFDAEGDLETFISQDRFQSADGKTYLSYPWETPVRAYGNYPGGRLPSRGDAIWLQPDAALHYGRFEMQSIDYNVTR